LPTEAANGELSEQLESRVTSFPFVRELMINCLCTVVGLFVANTDVNMQAAKKAPKANQITARRMEAAADARWTTATRGRRGAASIV
jgi:hypothetical protein